MKSINIDINFDSPSLDEWDRLAYAVDDYYMTEGSDKDYNPINRNGELCEEILDIVSLY